MWNFSDSHGHLMVSVYDDSPVELTHLIVDAVASAYDKAVI